MRLAKVKLRLIARNLEIRLNITIQHLIAEEGNYASLDGLIYTVVR